MPDIDLLLWNKVKSGDTEAFELLFRKHYPMLCLLSKRFTNNMDISREVVQDLFIYLWEHRNDIDITSFKAYLLRAVKYNSIRRIQNEKRLSVKMDNLPELSEDPVFFDHLEYAELQEKILEAISNLPEQCKKVFKLSRFQDLKYAEIAQQLNISVKTVEAHISKALRLIQNHLGSNFTTFLTLLIINSL